MVGERLFLGVGVIEWWRAAKQVRRSIHKQEESINEEKKQRGRRAVVDSGRGGLVHPSSSSPFVGVFIFMHDSRSYNNIHRRSMSQAFKTRVSWEMRSAL